MMASEPPKEESVEPPISYLFELSRTRLHQYHLMQLNKSANSRKQLSNLVEEWVEERALAMLSAWLLEYGEELIIRASEPREPKPQKEADNAQPEPLPVAKPQRFEFWRSGERRVTSRRRAG